MKMTQSLLTLCNGVLFWSSTLSLLSCQSLTGTYSTPSERITFRPDSTYEFQYNVGWNKKYSEGFWLRMNRSTIFLKESFHVDSLKIRLKPTATKVCSMIISPVGESEVVNYFIYEILIAENQTIKVFPNNPTPLNQSLIGKQLLIKVSLPNEEIRPYPLRNVIYSKSFSVNCDSEKIGVAVEFPINLNLFYAVELKGDTIKLKGSKILWNDRVLKKKPSP